MARVITGKARLSYPALFKPKAFGANDPVYSAVFLIPKTDKATVQKLMDAKDEAAEDGKEEIGAWKGKIPANLHSFLRDGDKEKPDQAEYKGMYFISAKSKNAPKVYDTDGSDLLDPQELYPGCWVRADLNIRPYGVNGNNGIAAYISSVKKFKDGERLAGYSASASAYDDDYEDEDDDLM